MDLVPYIYLQYNQILRTYITNPQWTYYDAALLAVLPHVVLCADSRGLMPATMFVVVADHLTTVVAATTAAAAAAVWQDRSP